MQVRQANHYVVNVEQHGFRRNLKLTTVSALEGLTFKAAN
jgi:hypothetical protein